MTEQISSADWQAKVLESDKTVLVDFFATWCGPCKMMAPVVDEIAAEKADEINVFKIDVDESPDIARQYGVMSIPTFISFKGGEPAGKLLGAMPKEQLLEIL